MEAMKKEYSISEMADALEVSASGYADHLKKEERPRNRQDREFGEKLKAIFHGSRKTYGLPRLQSALRDEGIGCGKKRIARLQRRLGLHPEQKRRFRPKTTQSDPETRPRNFRPFIRRAVDSEVNTRSRPRQVALTNCWSSSITSVVAQR